MKQQLTLKDSGMRWAVLVLVSLTMFFAYMFVDVLSPLKTMLETEVNWSSTTFGTYAGSEFFLNVFVFFLIFAGVILDKMGIRFTAILSGALMVIGAGIKLYALSEYFISGGLGYDFLNSFIPSFPATAKLASVGFAIFGCGCEMGGVTVSRILVKWFSGKQLALAMGLEMAIARLGVFAVFQLSPRLANLGDPSIMRPVFVVSLLLCVGLIFYILYSFLDKKLDEQLGGASAEEEEPFRLSDLRLIAGSSVFWIVALLCVLFYSAIFPFQKFSTEMIANNLGVTTEVAASIFSIFPMGALFMTPIIGGLLDYYGKGATMLMAGSIMMAGCHLIFAFYPFVPGETVSYVVMIATIVVLGVSFSLVPASLWPSVPKLIDSKVLGSAYSAIFWVQNVGLLLVPMLIGAVLERTNIALESGQPMDYKYAMVIFSSFGVIAFILAFILKTIDRKKGYGLELPNVKK
ncbi:MAG: MFS transporter [Porphyromonadaceae bacterium]|nr:MFS transporter [Porphyromonadaceae bacterium]